MKSENHYKNNPELYSFNMDDLKLFAESVAELYCSLMEFGNDKCQSDNLRRRLVVDAGSFLVNVQQEIRNMVESESHKYLGFLKLRAIRQPNSEVVPVNRQYVFCVLVNL